MRPPSPGRSAHAFAALALVALATSACSARYISSTMGVEGRPDPSVTVFRADTSTSWTSFRLGGGLNVVVVNPSLPREFAWRFNTGSDGVSASPVVYRNLVLVDSNDHHLYAADAATGHVTWKYRAESQLMSQPVYENGIIVIATGTGDCSVYYPPYYVSMDASVDRLEGLSLETGREVWSTGLAGTGMPTPALIGNTVIHVDGDGAVLAVDERTGAYRWHALTRSIFSMTGVVDGRDGRIYAPGSFPNDVYAWNARDGSLVWRHVFSPLYGGISDGPLASTPETLVGMYLQATGPGPEGWDVQYLTPSREHVYALDKRTGRVLWDRVVPNSRDIAPRRNESSIPLLYRGRVYIGSSEAPVVTAVDLRTGRVAWQIRTKGSVKGGMVGLNGIVYFGDLGGYLWAVDAQSGRVIGRKRENVHFNVGSPIVVNESLIDGTQEGAVIALPLRWIRDAHD